MKRVLRAIEAARDDGLNLDVRGMDEFDIGDFGTELDEAETFVEAGNQFADASKAGLQES